jgi:hypothetical protein
MQQQMTGFYNLLFGCDFVMDQQRVCIRFCANFDKGAVETLAMIRQAFREDSMGCIWVFEWKIPKS